MRVQSSSANRLFRAQAWQAQFKQGYGSALLLPTLRIYVLTCVALSIIIGLCLFISVVKFSDIRTVPGWIEKENLFSIASHQGNMQIQEMLVSVGQEVSQGQLLFVLSPYLLHRDQKALAEEELAFSHQLEKLEQDAELKYLLIEQKSLIDLLEINRDETRNLHQQLNTQNDLVKMSQTKLSRLQKLGKQQLISLDALENEKIKLSQLRLKQQSLQQAILKLSANKHQQQSKLTTVDVRISAIHARKDHHDKQFNLQLSKIDAEQLLYIRAPVNGVITQINVKANEQLDIQQTLAKLKTNHSDAKIILAIPSHTAGAIKNTQGVIAKVDAFPFQEFGGLQGTIASISESLSLPSDKVNNPIGVSQAFFKAQVSLNPHSLDNFNKDYDLRHGMSVSADIVISKRTLLDWMLAPFMTNTGLQQ